MSAMRRLDKENRLQGYSHPDISGELEAYIARLGGKIKYNGNKLRPGPLLNAIVLWFLEHSEEERTSLATRMVERLEHFMAGDEPIGVRQTLSIPKVQTHPEIISESGRTPVKPQGRRKGANGSNKPSSA